jgi:hypothetical protein
MVTTAGIGGPTARMAVNSVTAKMQILGNPRVAEPGSNQAKHLNFS